MSESFLTERIQQLPKAELHRHLAGAISSRTLLEAARRFNAPLPAVTADKLREVTVLERPMRSLQEVLARFEVFADLCSSPAVVEFIAEQAVLEAAREGIRYLELRFSPGFLSYRHGLVLGEVMEAVLSGVERGMGKADIVVPLIAIASREMGPVVCADTFELATRYRPWVVGVDLAGDEDNYPPGPFRAAFTKARDAGLQVTVHAGEQAHPENVRVAVEELGATRIGHGIQIVDHPELMELLAARDVALEISLTSNWIVGAVPSVADHPIDRLAAAGVPVTINSDDPGLFGISLTSELLLYAETFGHSLGHLVNLQRLSLDHAFAPESAVGPTRAALHAWWNQAS